MKHFLFFLTGLFLLFSCQKYEIEPDAKMSASVKSLKPKFKKEVTDVDGNAYKSVKIGKQVWMAENLRTTKFNDGTEIQKIEDNVVWSNLTSPAYCWYDNDEASYHDIYGALYNWYAANTGKLCPTGWHVPSSADFTTLNSYLGDSDAGGKLKESGTSHWLSPNTGATNESGFTALPGGVRGYYNNSWGFYNIRFNGFWWASDELSAANGWQLFISTFQSYVNIGGGTKANGYSIRCLKD